jgi:uncharacterized protein YqeY
MNLKDKISVDMKDALKTGDKIRLWTLRLLVSAMRYQEIENKKELSVEEIYQVVSREVKKRREAASEYRKGNREELAEKEEKEAAILETYLPPQLSDEEIEKIIKQAINEVKPMGPGDMGKVMSVVMPKVKGRADGKKVNEAVKAMMG